MANVKISDLTAASAVADANQLEINEAGSSKRVTAAQIKTYATADTVSASSGGTFGGDVDVTGTVTADGFTLDGYGTFDNSGTNLVIQGTNSGGVVQLKNHDGTEDIEFGQDYFRVKQGGSEKMRLDASGNLLVGGSSFGYDGSQDCVQINQSEGRIDIENNTTGTVYNLSFYNPNGNVGKISTSSSSTNYSTSSDYRLKENVADLTGATDRLKQLEPKRFNFIADADTTVDGFLAHQAQSVVPEAVTGTHNEVEVWSEGEELPDGVSVGDNKLNDKGETIPVMQGIDQGKLVPLLTAALQEAIAKIETLETKVAALEAE